MHKDQLRRSDFKTGIFLILFCLWYLGITFVFMPFKETYGGVENVWYVSPWIFPAVILTLLLVLSTILTINAVVSGGMRDVAVFTDNQPGSYRLTRLGICMNGLLTVASGAGLIYLVINIEEKIQFTIDESKWLADPSHANIFSWSSPLAIVPLTVNSFIFMASTALLVSVLCKREHRVTASFQSRIRGLGETTIRFAIIAILFCVLVYLLVPNVDFFIAIHFFLIIFTSCFYVENNEHAKLSMATYSAFGVLVLLVFSTNLNNLINAGYENTTDIIFLILVIAYSFNSWIRLAKEPEDLKKFKTCLAVSWITPLVLVPTFRFGLLVPLPFEGAVIELMHQLRYFLL